MHRSRGFSIVELIVALGVLAASFSTIYGAVILADRSVTRAARRTQALFILEEAVEAMRYRRDSGWTANIASPALTLSTTPNYCLTYVAGAYVLTATSPCPTAITANVKVAMNIQDVCRNSSTGDIVGVTTGVCSGSTLDSDTKRVTVTASWDQFTESVDFYIADLFGN
ncbi:MAG: type II secretion system protein [Patescibacteria group bacterium]